VPYTRNYRLKHPFVNEVERHGRMPSPARLIGLRSGLHSEHGLFPARTASSRLAYRTRFLAAIFAADLQSARWNTDRTGYARSQLWLSRCLGAS
jgi:hypothetical protein